MKFFMVLASLMLTACVSVPPPEQRYDHANTLAATRGWQPLRLPAGEFVLTAYTPAETAQSDTMTVYIEGDGQAWLTSSIAADDPTPRKPVALELALRDPGAAAYLARPCQFTAQADWRSCKQAYWTNQRFAPEVITASSQAIDALKQRAGASKLVLVGFSGGGAVAALVAARRQDVVRLVTVAGNLDTKAWTALHHLSALHGSLNPADAWEALQAIPQLHLVGGKDKNVSVEVAESFAARFPARQRPTIRVVPGADHGCCWAELWPGLLSPGSPERQ